MRWISRHIWSPSKDCFSAPSHKNKIGRGLKMKRSAAPPRRYAAPAAPRVQRGWHWATCDSPSLPDPAGTPRAPFLPWVSYFPRYLPVPVPQSRVPGPGIIFELICGTVVTDGWMYGWSLSFPLPMLFRRRSTCCCCCCSSAASASALSLSLSLFASLTAAVSSVRLSQYHRRRRCRLRARLPPALLAAAACGHLRG